MPDLLPGTAELLAALWQHPTHRLLLLTTIVEVGLVGLQVLALCVQMLSAEGRRRGRTRLDAALESRLMDAAHSGPQRVSWVHKARRWPRSLVREMLSDHLLRASGDYLEGLCSMYRALGFLDEDLAYLSSNIQRRRVLALRHLHRVAGPKEAPALLAARGDEHVVWVMATQVMARVGTPAEMVLMMQDLILSSRLMEQPVGAMLRHMHPDHLEALLRHWDGLACSAVRRLVLVSSARTIPGASQPAVERAAGSDQLEDRIGAAIASALLPPGAGVPLMKELLSDPEWQVRAQAARGLGDSADPLAPALLGALLDDMEFWVRRNAAESLSRLGSDGVRRLRVSAEAPKKSLGSGNAREALQRLALKEARAPA